VPPAWSCKQQRIVHLRPKSASASPSGMGRERLKRCLTFWSLQQASPSRDLHACQRSQWQTAGWLPFVTEIGTLALWHQSSLVDALHILAARLLFPIGRECYISLCTSRFMLITSSLSTSGSQRNCSLTKGGGQYRHPHVWQLCLRPLPETSFGAAR
jgi:hypothetical protein